MLTRAVARAAARLGARHHARMASSFMSKYQEQVAERAAMGIVPTPLDAAQTAELVTLMQDPPADEAAELLELLRSRVPPGVDEAAYVKAGFLAAVAKGEAKSPSLSPQDAVYLLGTMQGGYNILPLVEALDDPALAEIAADALSKTILMFDAFNDVEEKAKAGNACAKRVMQSWADAEWFTSRPEVPEKITVTVFKVAGETNTDDLSPAPDAWSRPDIPLHALAMLKFPREGIHDSQAQIKEELAKVGAPCAPHAAPRTPRRRRPALRVPRRVCLRAACAPAPYVPMRYARETAGGRAPAREHGVSGGGRDESPRLLEAPACHRPLPHARVPSPSFL